MLRYVLLSIICMGILKAEDDHNKHKEVMMSQNSLLPEFSVAAKSFAEGDIFKHYKGFLYQVMGVARHTETLEELVVYKALYGNGDVWVRPVKMFLETVVIDGETKPRFELISRAL